MAKKATKKTRTRRPRTTDAQKVFAKNAKRARSFLTIHKNYYDPTSKEGGTTTKKRRGAPEGPYRELPRGAVVFAVGALDAYLSEVTAEVLVSQLASAPGTEDARETLKIVNKELPGLSLEVALVPTADGRAERIRQALTEHFHDKVSQHGPKAVNSTLGRVGAKKESVWAKVANSHDDPQKLLEAWTEKRHRIVHQGKAVNVGRSSADECITLIESIVDAVDHACVGRLGAS